MEEIILLIVAHYVSDFLCQAQWMAEQKSTSNIALSAHVFTLSVVLLMFLCISPLFSAATLMPFSVGAKALFFIVFINGSTHWVIDYFSSRAMKKAWKEKKVRKFFNILGFDQALHVGILFISYNIPRYYGGIVFG